jgi:phosphate transport system substrate-binding protein
MQAKLLNSSLARWITVTVLGLVATWLQGCAPAEQQTLVVRGSNTIGEELAPGLAKEFVRQSPGVKFDFEFKGTSYGFGALLVGRCDIAAASRDMSKAELELARDRAVQVNEYAIGYYSVAVVVNAANPVAGLTKQQVRDIFTGTIKNWKDVGGPDAAIFLCVRDPISGAHLGFKELAMENQAYGEGLHAYTNHAAVVQTVAGNPHAIGYVSIETASGSGVKALAIGGVVPSVASVQKGEYPYGRLLRLYTQQARESAAARAFIEFIRSKSGQKLVDEMGYVPKG